MTAEIPSLPPAGWYPDPADPVKRRYWTGSSWGPNAPVAQTPQPAYGYAITRTADGPSTQPPSRASANLRGGWSLGSGITAVVLFWVPLLFWVTTIAGGILAIVFGVKGRRLAAQGLASNPQQATAGFVLGIIGVSLGGINAVIGAVIGATQGAQAVLGG